MATPGKTDEVQAAKRPMAEEWADLCRQRGDLQISLRAALKQTEAESQELAHALVALHESLGSLSAEAEGEAPDAETIRRLRRRLHDAGIQLALFDRRRNAAEAVPDNLASLPFRDLVRLGGAFLLPLIVALLAAALIVAFGLEMAMGGP
jgi:hypothetical protein